MKNFSDCLKDIQKRKEYWKSNGIPDRSTGKEEWDKWYRDKYLRSPHWKKVRTAILKRDCKRCQKCGDRHRLQVHHLYYHNVLYRELENSSCVITLCHRCHEKEHDKSFRRTS